MRGRFVGAFAGWCGWLLLTAGFAVAQADPIEVRYTDIRRALTRADGVVGERPDAALAALTEAGSALVAWASNDDAIAARLPVLTARTRQAITRGRVEEARAGIALLGGINERLLFDAAIAATLEGRAGATQARLRALSRDLGFAAEVHAALTDPSTPLPALRFWVEEGVAGVLARDLDGIESLDSSAAYLAFTRGYAHLLIVQESPRAPDTTAARYLAGAEAAANGGPGSWASTGTALAVDLERFAAAAAARRATIPRSEAPPTAADGAGGALTAVGAVAMLVGLVWWWWHRRHARRPLAGTA